MVPLRFSLAVASILGPLVGLFPLHAKDYYVSVAGFDGALGTLSQPFRTIQKAASIMVAGDTTYIRAGVYRETVKPTNSGSQAAPITFTAYNNESVTVSGADQIAAASWKLSSGNIYKSPLALNIEPWCPEVAGDGRNQLFLDGQMMIEARWPNTGLDVSLPAHAGE